MSSFRKFSRQIIVRLFEVLTAFAVVFFVALLWSRIEKFLPFKSDSLKVSRVGPENLAQVPELQNTPDMKTKVAFVRVLIAKVLTTPDESQVPIDHLTYGSQVFINGFESDGRYAHIKTADGATGFVVVEALAKDLQLDEARNFSGANDLDSKKIFKKYFGDAGGLYPIAGLTVDFSGGILRSSFSLTRFLQELSGFKSSSKVDFNNQTFSMGIISPSDSAKNELIYPNLPTFLSFIRSAGSGVLLLEERRGNANANAGEQLVQHLFELSLSKQVSAVYLADGLASKTSLRGLSLSCEGNDCSISIQSEAENQRVNGLQVLFFDRVNKMNPRLTKRVFNPEDPFEIYFVDVDGDDQQDVAFYSNQGSGYSTAKDLLYVAYSKHGVWQVTFVSESLRDSNIAAHFEPEPGSFDRSVFVRISSSSTGRLVYTTNGEDPKCPSSLKESAFSLSEADLYIQKTTTLKAAVCHESAIGPAISSAVYVIK